MLREMYLKERQIFEKTLGELENDSALLESFLATIFTTPEEVVKTHKKREFLRYFYLDGMPEEEMKGKVIPRRYWQKPEILGWDIFATEAAASKIVYEATGKRAITTYEQYCGLYIKQMINPIKIARGVLLIAYTLLSAQEVAEKQMSGEWEEWLETCKIWYAYSFIHTVWNGKLKEKFFEDFSRPEIAKYANIRLAKSAVEKDMKYKIDYVLLDTTTKQPLAAISVKGLSWFYSNEGATSTYQAWGEKREKSGHRAFKKEYGVPVKIIVSEAIPGGELGVVADIRQILLDLEAEGVIEKVQR